MSEAVLLARILDALRRDGRVLAWRNNTGRLQSHDGRWVRFGLGLGSPDIVGILKGSGRFLGIEVKTEGGKLSPEQLAWHCAAATAGAIGGVARSVDDALLLLDSRHRRDAP